VHLVGFTIEIYYDARSYKRRMNIYIYMYLRMYICTLINFRPRTKTKAVKERAGDKSFSSSQ